MSDSVTERDEAEIRTRELALAFARGEEAAFEDAYRRYAPAVAAFLRAVMGSQYAEDVTHETFVYAWRRAERYRPDLGPLGGWLMTIARSRAVDHHRAAARRPQGAPLHDDLVNEEPSGIDALHSTWAFAALLADLSDIDRRIMALRFQGGLSQTEIAEQLNLPLGTVKTRMTRALHRLRGQWDEGKDGGR